MTIGEKLRQARKSAALPLSDVAGNAGISVATLSRIETGKQSLEFGTFLLLAKILNRDPGTFFEEGENSDSEPLVQRLIALGSNERMKVWNQLATAMRSRRTSGRAATRQLGLEVEELLAQLDYLRSEIESVKKRLNR